MPGKRTLLSALSRTLVIALVGALSLDAAAQVSQSSAPKPSIPGWVEDAWLVRVLLQPPRLYNLDARLSLDESYFAHKLQGLTSSTSIVRDWREAHKACQRKMQPSCSTGSAYSALLDLSIRQYAAELHRRSRASPSDTQPRASPQVTAALRAEWAKIRVPAGFDTEREFSRVDSYLRAVLLVRYGRERTFLSVHSPATVGGWIRKRAREQKIKPLHVPSDQNVEVALLQIYSQNLCTLLEGRENLFCQVMFHRAPLNSMDYLLVSHADPGTTDRTVAEQRALSQLAHYQYIYIAGQERETADWWRSLFPLKYGEFGGDLDSGWGDRATLALRRSKRELPDVLVNGIQARIAAFSSSAGALQKPFVTQLRAIFPEAPVYVHKSDTPDDSISIFGFEVGGKKKNSGPEMAAADEFLKRLADPAQQVSLQAGDAQTIAGLLAPGLVPLGADAYKVQATWRDRAPRIVLSEPILLSEYARCLAADQTAPTEAADFSPEQLTFEKLLMLLHAHAVDLAALDNQVPLDADTLSILNASPFMGSVSHGAPSRNVGRVAVANALKVLLKRIDTVLAVRAARGWTLPSQCVVNRLSFALAHEVAHVALGAEGEIDPDESAADCVGFLMTRALKITDTMALTSVSDIGPSLFWNARGPSTSDQIRARQARLDALDRSVSDATAASAILSSAKSLSERCVAPNR